MSWQIKICCIFLISGLFLGCFGFAGAQEAENGDFRALKAKVGGLVAPGFKKLQNAFFRIWQIVLNKTGPFLAYVGEIAEKRKDIVKQEFKKEIDEMKEDCFALVGFFWKKIINNY